MPAALQALQAGGDAARDPCPKAVGFREAGACGRFWKPLPHTLPIGAIGQRQDTSPLRRPDSAPAPPWAPNGLPWGLGTSRIPRPAVQGPPPAACSRDTLHTWRPGGGGHPSPALGPSWRRRGAVAGDHKQWPHLSAFQPARPLWAQWPTFEGGAPAPSVQSPVTTTFLENVPYVPAFMSLQAGPCVASGCVAWKGDAGRLGPSPAGSSPSGNQTSGPPWAGGAPERPGAEHVSVSRWLRVTTAQGRRGHLPDPEDQEGSLVRQEASCPSSPAASSSPH